MIEISNKRIYKYSKNIRDFVLFLNENYDISEKINLYIIYKSSVAYDNFPCFGFFSINGPGLQKNIFVASDLRKYKKLKNENKKILFILETIAHELVHYFQYKRGVELHERKIQESSCKILKNYIEDKKYSEFSIMLRGELKKYINNKNKEEFYAIK